VAPIARGASPSGVRTRSGELVQRQLAGAHVVKAFNTILPRQLSNLARPAGSPDRSALPIAGDDPVAKTGAARLLDLLGWDAVDTGTLADSWRIVDALAGVRSPAPSAVFFVPTSPIETRPAADHWVMTRRAAPQRYWDYATPAANHSDSAKLPDTRIRLGPMRRFSIAATALLLLLFGAQAALAAYGPSGSLTLSSSTSTAGAALGVSGDGFDPGSNVQVTIHSTPVLLTTVAADGSGNFSVTVTIPAGFDGLHQITATGLDPAQSVLVLQSPINLTSTGLPSTDTVLSNATGSSDLAILALSGAGIVLLTCGVLFATRRMTAR
jgi:hypothetical protein